MNPLTPPATHTCLAFSCVLLFLCFAGVSRIENGSSLADSHQRKFQSMSKILCNSRRVPSYDARAKAGTTCVRDKDNYEYHPTRGLSGDRPFVIFFARATSTWTESRFWPLFQTAWLVPSLFRVRAPSINGRVSTRITSANRAFHRKKQQGVGGALPYDLLLPGTCFSAWTTIHAHTHTLS
jgi:hypothetical protein